MSTPTYHGPTPVTEDDIKMAKDHLKRTFKLNKEKIKEHKKAMKSAIDSDNKKSFRYNKTHASDHEKDNQRIQRSMKTANSLTPDKTYDDVRKDKVAIMARKAES